MWNNHKQQKLFSLMSNLQTYYHFKLDCQKVDQQAGGKWSIHGTKSRKDNQLQSLEVTTEHHTFGSPTVSAPILNNTMTTYDSIWYQNIARSAENKFGLAPHSRQSFVTNHTSFILMPVSVVI